VHTESVAENIAPRASNCNNERTENLMYNIYLTGSVSILNWTPATGNDDTGISLPSDISKSGKP